MGDVKKWEDSCHNQFYKEIDHLKAELSRSQRREATANQNTAEAAQKYLTAENEVKGMEIQVFNLESEIADLREMCREQDQENQRISRWRDLWKAVAKSLYYYESPTMRRADRLLRKQNHDDWPMEYDPQVLLEASEVMHAKSRLREAIPDEREQLKAQIAELERERAQRKMAFDNIEAKAVELEHKLATCQCMTSLLRETELIGDVRAQRDDLLEALIDVIHQSCGEASQVDGQLIVDPMALSAYEDALKLLEKLGYAKELGNRRYELTCPK